MECCLLCDLKINCLVLDFKIFYINDRRCIMFIIFIEVMFVVGIILLELEIFIIYIILFIGEDGG